MERFAFDKFRLYIIIDFDFTFSAEVNLKELRANNEAKGIKTVKNSLFK